MSKLLIETTLYSLICFAIYFTEPQASEWLAYYHTGISQFELWRLITATFCHTNFNHLVMNVAGLIITLALFIDSFKNTTLLPLIIFSSLFIGLALYFLEPNVLWYVGFSGVLHGLFSYGVISDIHNKDKWGIILGVGLVAKIAYEQFFGAQQNTIELIGAPVLVNAHLYGAIAGFVFYFMKLLKTTLLNKFEKAQ
ncbi:rhombosortase [Psychromonas hadalis]|uniref:rhombosortase n=1 Tax=Psychromonas hadalis TaxID=211669 RepID=UPI0003B75205|nr:rhombosortase [Psychromonas hadalis]